MANGGVSFVNLVIYQHNECVGCTPTNGNLEFTVRFPDDVTGTKPYYKNHYISCLIALFCIRLNNSDVTLSYAFIQMFSYVNLIESSCLLIDANCIHGV